MIWFADFETRFNTATNRAEVYLGYIEELESESNSFFIDITSMMNFIKSKSRNKVQYVYFHNLTFDGEFIIWWLLYNNYVPLKEYDKNKKMTFSEMTDGMGSRREISVNYDGVKLVFLDSLKLFPFSVDSIGAELGFPKLEINHNDEHNYNSIDDVPEYILDYCRRDVQIIKKKWKVSSQYYDLKKTLSSTSWTTFEKWYNETYSKDDFTKRYLIDKDTYDYLLPAYFGGLTLLNDDLVNKDIQESIYYYDINSSYPSIFVDELLPYGKPLKEKPNGDYVYLVKATIKNIKKIDNIPPHLHNIAKTSRFNQSYISNYCDIINVIYTDKEWEQINLTYTFDIIEQEIIYFKADNKLSGFITKLYHLKQFAPNKIERNEHKRILNSFYGKWGQNYKHIRKDLILDRTNESRRFHYLDYVYENTIEESDTIKYLPVAIWITSYARVKLLKAIRANKESFIYCDTDSVILHKNPAVGLELHESELGKWKLENTGVRFKVLKTKCYLLELEDGTIKRTIAGMSKSKVDLINFDNFFPNTTIPNGNRKSQKINGGVIIVEQETTL